MWCKSAVSFSCGFLVAACRIRSTACDTLVPTLRPGRALVSQNSPWLRPFPPAAPQALALPCSPPSPVVLPHPTSSFRDTIGFGILLPSAAPVRLPGRNEDLPGPNEGRTNVHGFWSLNRPGRPFVVGVLQPMSLPPSPLRLLPAGATVAGRDSHPLRNGALSRRTE